MITTESTPHASLESSVDSKPTLAVGHCPTAIESSFSSERRSEQALKASSGRGDCQGGRERPRNLSPSPLDEKENTIEEVKKISEVKAKDSEKVDSESKRQTESAKTLDSEKWNLESNAFTSLDSKTSSIALSQKEKGFIPSRSQDFRSPLNPEKNKASAFSFTKETAASPCFRQSRGVPRLSASSSSVAAALLPPCFNASAPDSLRDSDCATRDFIFIAVERDSTAGEFRIRVRF